MILFRQITDILNAIESDPDEAKEACVYIRDELKDILRGYECALKSYGYDIPYGHLEKPAQITAFVIP